MMHDLLPRSIMNYWKLRYNRNILLILLFISIHILTPADILSQVCINEILASNRTVYADPDYGEYCDWIELYNNTGHNIDISGYYLSDDTNNLVKWQIPQGTVISAYWYILVYADERGHGMHSNFRLSKQGEKLILASEQLEIIDSLSYPYQLVDISYGRDGDDPGIFGYYEIPSPGKKNFGPAVEGISSSPVFSAEGGFYDDPLTIEITTSSPDAEIYYTLDGTEPSENSPKYINPLFIDSTSVLRVKTFEDNMFPGLVVTHSFFINETQNLPVISLVTDPDHFFSDETGIYVIGTAGVEGYCTDVPHNVNQDWERPVNVELFETDGTRGLNQLAGVKIFGGCSRVRYPVKSLALYARKIYETSSFKCRLFPDRTSEEYESFILRASADDQPFTLFRDPLTQMLVKDVIDVDVQAHRPIVVYINGEYWGIHNLREKISEHYIEDNYGVDPESVDLLRRNPENSWNVIAGDAGHYNAMISYLNENDITQQVHYDYIKTQMDIDEYINYQIIEIFFGARDWPGNNIKFWRSEEESYNRWRWILYDLDQMFKEYFSDIMDEATEVDCGCYWPNPPWSTYLFRRLLQNEEFKHEFIQRFSIYSNTWFSRERLHGFIDEMQAELAPEIPRHIERWGGQKTDLPDNTWVSPIFNSVEKWEANVQVMRNFTDTRHEMALKHINDYFGIEGLSGFEINIEPAGTGELKVGNTVIHDSLFSGEFCRGENLLIHCFPDKGYVLSHWQVNKSMANDTTLIKKGDEWKYYISWDTPDSNWTSFDYDDSHWESGYAELGYGDGDEETEVDYGGNSENKIITTWFRKKFFIGDSSMYKRYTVHLLRDDGIMVFLNGREIIRDNMNRWSVGPYSPAEEEIEGDDESVFHTFHLNPALINKGENIIAVEIHQASNTSTDISFDLDLIASSFIQSSQENVYIQSLELELVDYAKVTAIMIPDTNVIEKIFINELLARNNAGLMDEAGDFDDWIELYNANDKAVDLAGLYLTDSLPAIDPWLFPSGHPGVTTILPDSFIVIFADNEPEQGLLHAGFRLSGDGEEVVLFQKIGEGIHIIDHVPFGAQSRNVTFGRYPDGSAIFEFMPVNTPGSSNTIEPVITNTNSSTIDLVANENVILYPVPTDGLLFVKFNLELSSRNIPVEICIYDLTGKKVSMTQHRSSELIRLSLENQPEGVYFVKIRTGEDVFVKRVVLF